MQPEVVHIIPYSTAKCERDSSYMNIIVSTRSFSEIMQSNQLYDKTRLRKRRLAMGHANTLGFITRQD